jgi:hypothetical protein
MKDPSFKDPNGIPNMIEGDGMFMWALGGGVMGT